MAILEQLRWINHTFLEIFQIATNGKEMNSGIEIEYRMVQRAMHAMRNRIPFLWLIENYVFTIGTN